MPETTMTTPQDYAQPLCWVNEDELPESLSTDAYNALFPFSMVDGVRLFPIYAAPQSGWLSIESAPKDFVTEFDGWNGGRVTGVIWARPDGAPKGENDWCISEYESNWGWKMERVRGLTHWMPLPLPPSTKGESTNDR